MRIIETWTSKGDLDHSIEEDWGLEVLALKVLTKSNSLVGVRILARQDKS